MQFNENVLELLQQGMRTHRRAINKYSRLNQRHVHLDRWTWIGRGRVKKPRAFIANV